MKDWAEQCEVLIEEDKVLSPCELCEEITEYQLCVKCEEKVNRCNKCNDYFNKDKLCLCKKKKKESKKFNKINTYEIKDDYWVVYDIAYNIPVINRFVSSAFYRNDQFIGYISPKKLFRDFSA